MGEANVGKREIEYLPGYIITSFSLGSTSEIDPRVDPQDSAPSGGGVDFWLDH